MHIDMLMEKFLLQAEACIFSLQGFLCRPFPKTNRQLKGTFPQPPVCATGTWPPYFME